GQHEQIPGTAERDGGSEDGRDHDHHGGPDPAAARSWWWLEHPHAECTGRPSENDQPRHSVTSIAMIGPVAGSSRYCGYLSASRPSARANSVSPPSSTRPRPRARTHHAVLQSSS